MNESKKFLKNSLLYQMSLGSKELFHSNVWAWLMEKENKIINVFFDDVDLGKYEKPYISRECKNRDIIIWLIELLNTLIENNLKGEVFEGN